MRKIVLRISPLAKIAVTVTMIGMAIALYGKLKGVGWANGLGSALFFGGVVVYVIERYRSLRSRRD